MIDLETPRTDTRRDVLVLPYARPWVGGPDHANAPFHARVLRGREAQDQFDFTPVPGATPEIPGRFLYGGPLFDHFGHVMVDAIPRLWAYRPALHDGVVFPWVGPTPSDGVSGWIFDILERVGIPGDAVRVVHEPAIFESMDFAMPGSILRLGPEPWYLEWLQSRTLAMASARGGKIYYGRAHILGKGSVMGESYFSSALQANGFRYVKPELLSIGQQLDLASGAETIVFLEGSAIYITELLGRLQADVIMIPRRQLGHALFGPQLRPRARSFTSLDASLVRMNNLQGRKKPDSPSYLLNPATVYNDLQARGLVKHDFDAMEFRLAQERDAISYFRGDGHAARAQMAEIVGLQLQAGTTSNAGTD